MARRIAAIAFATAGIFLLAGPGWALLAAAVLVEVGWPRSQPGWVAGLGGRVLAGWWRLADAVRRIPKQLGAVGSASAGMALIPLGVGMFAGWGLAVLVLGVLTLALGLLLDRTA